MNAQNHSLSAGRLAALLVLLCGVVCLAGQPHGGDQSGGGMLMRPEGHDGHSHDVDFDERTVRIASQLVCPQYCGGGTVLAECLPVHYEAYGGMIAKLVEEGKSDEAIYAEFANRFGAHVLQRLAVADPAETDIVMGKITGSIKDVSESGQSVAGVTVKVLAYTGADAVEEGAAKSGADGAFVVSDLPVRGVAAFRVEAGYDGVDYQSGWMVLTPEVLQAEVILGVRATTADNSAISVSTHHIAVTEIAEGFFQVTEFLEVQNSGTKTVVSEDVSLGSFSIFLPQGVKDENVMLDTGFNQGTSAAVGGKIVDAEPFVPGMKQYMFRYIWPFGAEEVVFKLKTAYDTGSLNFVFPETEGVEISGVGFSEQRQSTMRGYELLAAQDVPAGAELSVNVKGLAVAPRNIFRWPALIAAAMIAVVAVMSLGFGRADSSNSA